MGRNILKSSVQNASFSIVFQILFRCITFVLNAFIIRHVGQDVLGIMNVRLLLLESTILFISQEPLLKACLTDTKSHNWAQVINQIWLSVPLSALLGFTLVYFWLNILSLPEDKYITQYTLGCYTMAFSCIIDQSMQSVILVARSFCFIKLKVAFETIYFVFRTTIFVILVLNYPSSAINAFSFAQITSSLLCCLLYYGFFWWYIKKLNNLRNIEKKLLKENSKASLIDSSKIFADMHDFNFKSVLDFLPGHMENKDKPFNKDLCILTVSFVKQCVVKQILTEGERYVMTISPVLSFSQQSMYDIVNNLGSIAARFIFRPIEESAYFYFTQMIKRDKPIEKQDKKFVIESVTVLTQLCKVVMSIGLVVVVFGQSYSHTLLHLYGGRALTEDPLPTTLLKCHCMAVLLLAVNGITECYVFATMSNIELDRYNYVMVFFSVSFLIISYVFTNFFGAVGFIFANCINMGARIVHSLYYIHRQYKYTKFKPLEGLVPDLLFILVLGVSGFLMILSELYVSPKSILLHVAIGAVCFLLTSLVWAFENQNLLKKGYDKYKRRISLKSE